MRRWIASEPYDGKGQLKPYWKRKWDTVAKDPSSVSWSKWLRPQTKFDTWCFYLGKFSFFLFKALLGFWTSDNRPSRLKCLFDGVSPLFWASLLIWIFWHGYSMLSA